MITTRAMSALLSAHQWRVASGTTVNNDFADHLGAVRFWQVCLLALILGLNNAFENSARQAFVREMVGPDELRNAVTLNSVTVNAARAVGPAIGGVLIATVGIGTCFLLNAASFAAVVTSLLVMDRAALQPSPPAPRARGQLREGLHYARRTPTIAIPLAMMSLVGLLAYEFPVSLPVLAQRTFHGGAEAYGFMTAALELGAERGMRGRAIALWQVAFQGTTPIGGPAIGAIIALSGPRAGLAVGGAARLVA